MPNAVVCRSSHSHLQTNYSKTFQRANVDFLETPEIVTTMLVPGKKAETM